jgi:DNA mismatch repair protein MutS
MRQVVIFAKVKMTEQLKDKLPKTAKEDTPLMQQYNAIKAKYPDALLLFRVGDFYETFNDDAVRASKVLGIVLTKRGSGAASEMDLAGFPHHSLDTYLPRLVRAGMRVAICDQLEDPKLTKKIVKRGVTEVVSPGVAFSDKMLDHRSNNFLAALLNNGELYGIALADVSTGEFLVAQGDKLYIEKVLQGFSPSELLLPRNVQKQFDQENINRYYTYAIDEWVWTKDYAQEVLLNHFSVNSLKGFGIEDMDVAIIAAGAVMHHLKQMQQSGQSQIKRIARVEEEKYVWLDRFTIRNLEIVHSTNEKASTLLDVLDKTITPMGARMLRRWLLLPLKEIDLAEERLQVVDYIVHNESFCAELIIRLRTIGDLERITSRIALHKTNPREILQLKRALESIAPLKEHCLNTNHDQLSITGEQLNPCGTLLDLINTTINNDPPAMVNKGGVIRQGISTELDELREIAYSGKDYLLKIQQEEVIKTGITSLKIAYNNVFGYYIEVTNVHKEKVPASWVRKQTLANAERYITDELKHYEEKILGAEEKILRLEEQLFNEFLNRLAEWVEPLQLNASILARLDCLQSYATASIQYNYTRPHLNDSLVIDIKNGRHPVLEQQMQQGEEYISNDLYLDQDHQQIIMITGPNMAGKSALLRQTALITLMAQAGCFVPAQSAAIGVVDKIFTRVGGSDNISQGESTFMVEMNETASILNNLSQRSLVLLDEIGRGTSTYDGISIAWAIAEFLHEHPRSKARTLFATHYHELNEMAAQFSRIKNYNVSIRESGSRILFLRKLVPGGSEHSFGIHVARLAGMPEQIIHRADRMLHTLENAHSSTELVKAGNLKHQMDDLQLSFFQLDDPLLEQIRDEIFNTDINTLTPVEALMKLNEIKKMIAREKAGK